MKDFFGHGSPLIFEDKKLSTSKNISLHVFRSTNLKSLLSVFNIHSRRLLRHWHFRLNKIELQQVDIAIERGIFSQLDWDMKNLVKGILCESGFSFDFLIRNNSKQVAEDFDHIYSLFDSELNWEQELSLQQYFYWSSTQNFAPNQKFETPSTVSKI
jgi:hypothetical protein